ncbi:MAG: thioredoxin [Pirellulales bacterium]
MSAWRNYKWQMAVVASIVIFGGLLVTTACALRRSSATHLDRPTSSVSSADEYLNRAPSTTRGGHAQITSATTGNFDEHVLRSAVPVLVDFYADWCRPCQIQSRVLEDFAAEAAGIKIVKVNVDTNVELAERFGVNGLPTLLIVKAGNVVARHSGVATKEQLKAALRD